MNFSMIRSSPSARCNTETSGPKAPTSTASIPAETSPTWLSCPDLHKYFKSVFLAPPVIDDAPQGPNTTEATECPITCFLCASHLDTTHSLAEHFRNEHIFPSIREYLNGSASDLALVLLFHYACVRDLSSQSRDTESIQENESERRRFFLKHNTYWLSKVVDRPDEQDFPNIAAHLRRLAVQDYSRYVEFRAHKAQKEQRRAALREAKRTSHWRCRCGVIFLSPAELSSHIAAAVETKSIADVRRTAAQHGWSGARSLVIDNTGTFSDLHRKLVHQQI